MSAARGVAEVADAPAEALLARAAEGELPAWSCMGAQRRAHAARVAGLLGGWASELALGEPAVMRWRAAGWLHDALRDAAGAELRQLVRSPFHDLPTILLHGPAAAELLRRAGVHDEELLDAIRYHTIGQRGSGRLGRALYLADFLEPGRTFAPAWRAGLLARLPAELDVPSLMREVTGSRIGHLLERGHPIRPETLDLWNGLADGR